MFPTMPTVMTKEDSMRLREPLTCATARAF